MKRLALMGLIPFALAAPAAAQPMDHSMPGMVMPTAPAKPAAKPAKKPPASAAHQHGAAARAAASQPAAGAAAVGDPHAGHNMPAGAAPMDHSSMPGMTMPAAPPSPGPAGMPGMDMSKTAGAGAPPMSQMEAPKTPPPPPPSDHAADRFYPPAAMAGARALLRHEHGGMPSSMVLVSLAEYQARAGADGYRWEGQGWFGGDINRLVLKTEGEGTRGQGAESAELQALYSRAVGVYTDLQVGVRQDFEPHDRTYATVGFQTLLPYWFDVEGAAFLSTHGELLGRIEGTYDLRLTNRLILQPRAELNFAAQNTAATRTGSGLSNAEVGLRLRYEIRREFAPYIGVSWDRQFGKTADYSRALGADVEATSAVIGVRAFF